MSFDDLLWEAISGKKTPSYSSASVEIGADVSSGEKLLLPIEKPNDSLSATHTYVMGGSGAGKTKWLEGIMRTIIKEGYGLVFLDGKGGNVSLYDDIVGYCARLDLEFDGFPLAKKTTLIDPSENDYCVGINFLERIGEQTSDALAGLVLEAIKKFFNEASETKFWLEEWGMATLRPLIEKGFTLLEMFAFLNLEDPSFRDSVIKEIGVEYYRDKWDRLKGFKRYEQEMRLGAVTTRADRFWQDRTLQTIFGQEKTTIDWPKVMDEGGIVLAKLGKTPMLPERTATLIGSAILNQVVTASSQREKGQRPFFFVVDEFQKFVNPDFCEALDLLRGYGISFVLAHQHRAQFREEAPIMMESIDSNCHNKIIFSCSDRNARDAVGDIFGGFIHTGAEEIKDEIWQTKFRPVKTYEEIITLTESTTYSQNVGDSDSRSVATLPNGEQIVTDTSGGSSGGSVSHTRGRSVVRAPFLNQEEYRELSNRTFYQLEEVRERYIALLQNQPLRNATWKFYDNRPMPFVTPTIKSVIVTDSIRRRFKDKVYSLSARPTAEVLEEVRKRVPRFLDYVAAKKSQMPAPPTQDPSDEELNDPIDHESEKSVK